MTLIKIAAVVLAAGKSQRMARNKLLLKFRGRTVLDHILSSLTVSKVDEVFVVLGHKPEDIESIVESHAAKAVYNQDYEEGMTSSFKAGLGRVSANAAFLCLGDQVVLDPDLIDRMIDVMETNHKTLIVSPNYNGRRGHPVLFREVLFPEIMGLEGKDTLKDLVERHVDQSIEIEGDIWCTLDMDTPEDFERIRECLDAEP